MRAVCLVDRYEFDFNGNILKNAIALGDIDNDNKQELVVGTSIGELGIFKYNYLLSRTSGLGMIAAVEIGDILNCGRNSLVVISGEGYCRIFNLPPEKTKLKLVHEQRIPANTKVAVLADIDSDGQVELIVGLTDRVVRSYRWSPSSSTSEGDSSAGILTGLHKWECATQIGSVTVNFGDDGNPCLLVAQPGGTRMKINCLNSVLEANDQSELSVDYHPLSRNRMRNPDISTEIIGGIRPPGFTAEDKRKGTRYAIATLDGTLMLMQNDNTLWSFQVDHQVFALRTLCESAADGDVLVGCAWDGQTYFLDQERRSVRFQFEETVCGFSAGEYNWSPDENSGLALVYTTFTKKIIIYYNVKIPQMVISAFMPKELSHVTDSEQRRKIVSYNLYKQT